MNRRARMAAVLGALLLPGLAVARFTAARIGDETSLTLQELPSIVGAWSLREKTSLSSDELEVLRPDDYVARRYEAPGRAAITLYVALYAQQSSYGNGAHDPAVCYPSQGWEVLATRSVQVALPGAEALVGTLLVAHHGRYEQKVLYWFQPARRWPQRQSREQLTRIWDALAGRPQYAFVRLAASSQPGSDPERDLLEFAAQIGWPVRAALGPDEPLPASSLAER